eukprot:1722426-Rhodomonas_salina.1
MGAVGDVSITRVALGSGPRRQQCCTFKHNALAQRLPQWAQAPRIVPTPPCTGTRTSSSWGWWGPRGGYSQRCEALSGARLSAVRGSQ